jgi:alkylation response protein AidB-like acyl-CoA dehydrogenase
MDLSYSEEAERFRASIRQWLRDALPDGWGDGRRPTGPDWDAFCQDWNDMLHRTGWSCPTWPLEYGGKGLSALESVILTEELADAGAPIQPPAGGEILVGPTILHWGDDRQKKRFLPPIVRGTEIWCQGFSEPDSGSDLASVNTRATRHGDEWVVTGQKVWTTFAQHAKWCMLVARTDADAPKHKGLSYFLMDMDQDAVQVRPLVQITGEAEFNELFIEEARIPHENIVGGEGNGWAVAITTLMHERATLAFGLQVRVQIALAELIEKARSTRASTAAHFASEDPVVRQRLAQLLIEAEVLRLNAYRGLTATMRDGVPGPEGSLGKWHWSDVNQSLTELAMEIAGPRAMLAEDEWTYRFLRARANSIEGGTTEILKNIVAERVLGLPRMR